MFPTHEQESAHNHHKLAEKNQHYPVASIKASSYGIHKNVPSDKASGLLKELHLCKEAKVMLTTNLITKFGLFNGSVGTVKDILYLHGRNPSSGLPDIVMVEFVKYSGPPFMKSRPKLVPIIPIERKIDCHCSCKRKQIPLRLGWGTTIHRCQGMTIGEGQGSRFIIISPGTKSFESRNPGAFFVALSRAKSAGSPPSTYPDFAFHPDVLINEDRLCHIAETRTTKARALEIERIKIIADMTAEYYHHLDKDALQIQLPHFSEE